MSAAFVDSVSHVRSARVLLLSEVAHVLASDSHDVVSVRTVGRLLSVDFATCQAVIEHQDAFLMLDIGTLYAFVAHVGALYEFVGELHCDSRTLRCRVWRSLGGCDLALFVAALRVHRESLDALNAAVDAANDALSHAVRD
jgi:hypothetical protein